MEKPALLLLHGALGAAEQFNSLAPLLTERYDVHVLDFQGHGRAPMPAGPFRMENFVQDVLAYVESNLLDTPLRIFGYSMGGFVACRLALARPDLVASVATLGTMYHWDPATAAQEVKLLDPAKIAAKVPQFARALAERHSAGWELVVDKTREMLLDLGEHGGLTPQQMATLTCRLRIMFGDRDPSINLSTTAEIYRAVPRGELEILPNTPHPLEKVPLPRLAMTLIEFLNQA